MLSDKRRVGRGNLALSSYNRISTIVLVTSNEETRVMDFGLSQLALRTGMTLTVRDVYLLFLWGFSTNV